MQKYLSIRQKWKVIVDKKDIAAVIGKGGATIRDCRIVWCKG